MAQHPAKFNQWQQIETVFLDMDGTLLDLYFDNHFWLEHLPVKYAEANQLSHDEAHAALIQQYGNVRGTLDWYCIDYWSRQLKLDIRQLKHEQAHRVAIRPNALHFLQAVNASNKRVVMVTNAHPATIEIKLEKTGIDQHFDRILNSHDVGLAKEQAGFWQQLHRIEPYDKDATMLIDDNLDVLHAAGEYGIAWLFAILQPDSQKAHVDAEPFHAIDDFAEFVSELPGN